MHIDKDSFILHRHHFQKKRKKKNKYFVARTKYDVYFNLVQSQEGRLSQQ